MIYDGKLTIVNIHHNIPAVPLIGNGKIIVLGQIMVVVFNFFDRSIENNIIYRFTKNIERHDHDLAHDGNSPLLIRTSV